MPLSTIEDAIEAYARGEFLIVVDDKDRENEGDLIIAADAMTPEKMAFMIRHTSGVICAPMSDERADALNLPLMVVDNTESMRTAFTVSVDLVEGTSTGISASDRSATVVALADSGRHRSEFARPGHIFPLRARAGGVLQRAGLNRLSALDPAPPIKRYTHDAPGDLLHLDIKKLGRFKRPGHRVTGDRQAGRSRGAGWDYVHVAIDDHSRVSHATIRPDETGISAVRALIASLRYYRGLGVTFKRVLTDNGACYGSRVFAKACRRLGLTHRRTRAYRPRTNGKAERLIQTALHEWAYARAYENADQRAAHLPHWLHDYNWHRPHASLNYHTPVSTLGIGVNNLVGLHS